MGNINYKYESFKKALESLEKAIINYEEILKRHESLSFMEHIEIVESMRDSMIQRFEFYVDLFWKYIKKYLEEVLKTTSQINAPAAVIRVACNSNLITPKDSELALNMFKSRNLTSHIYREEIADQISKDIPEYYKMMSKYLDILMPKN
ncbi:hypothetical protein GF385_01795 [Candidatus Dependentiae bacterium]|nr:hypothetical protein [Candidatus Dependentiae bacterium]